MPEEIPGYIGDYLQGSDYPEKTKDQEFYSRFARMLWNDVIMKYRNDMGGFKPDAVLPFMLCGGGRKIALYDQFIQKINGRSSSTSLRLKDLDIPVPEGLENLGIGPEVYQRLSVAYGLSFLDIGEVITSEMFPPRQPSVVETTYRDGFVGKEQV